MYSPQGELIMNLAHRGRIKAIREKYKTGSTVQLVSMEDYQAPKVGTKGKVIDVDDMGTVHVKWENGSTLGVIIGVDEVVLLS